MTGLALMIFGPYALGAAFGLAAILHRFRLMPRGVSLALGTILISPVTLGALMLTLAIQNLIVEPARMQSRYVGGQVASPFALRSYSEWGFQDPGKQWVYAIDPDTLAKLKLRCKRQPSGRGGEICDLGTTQSEGWYEGVYLEGDTLRIDRIAS